MHLKNNSLMKISSVHQSLFLQNDVIFAVSAISPTNGKTPSASSPADAKSPLARSTGIAKKSAIVSTPGISDTAVKKLLKASKLAP